MKRERKFWERAIEKKTTFLDPNNKTFCFVMDIKENSNGNNDLVTVAYPDAQFCCLERIIEDWNSNEKGATYSDIQPDDLIPLTENCEDNHLDGKRICISTKPSDIMDGYILSIDAEDKEDESLKTYHEAVINLLRYNSPISELDLFEEMVDKNEKFNELNGDNVFFISSDWVLNKIGKLLIQIIMQLDALRIPWQIEGRSYTFIDMALTIGEPSELEEIRLRGIDWFKWNPKDLNRVHKIADEMSYLFWCGDPEEEVMEAIDNMCVADDDDEGEDDEFEGESSEERKRRFQGQCHEVSKQLNIKFNDDDQEVLNKEMVSSNRGKPLYDMTSGRICYIVDVDENDDNRGIVAYPSRRFNTVEKIYTEAFNLKSSGQMETKSVELYSLKVFNGTFIIDGSADIDAYIKDYLLDMSMDDDDDDEEDDDEFMDSLACNIEITANNGYARGGDIFEFIRQMPFWSEVEVEDDNEIVSDIDMYPDTGYYIAFDITGMSYNVWYYLYFIVKQFEKLNLKWEITGELKDYYGKYWKENEKMIERFENGFIKRLFE